MQFCHDGFVMRFFVAFVQRILATTDSFLLRRIHFCYDGFIFATTDSFLLRRIRRTYILSFPSMHFSYDGSVVHIFFPFLQCILATTDPSCAFSLLSFNVLWLRRIHFCYDGSVVHIFFPFLQGIFPTTGLLSSCLFSSLGCSLPFSLYSRPIASFCLRGGGALRLYSFYRFVFKSHKSLLSLVFFSE